MVKEVKRTCCCADTLVLKAFFMLHVGKDRPLVTELSVLCSAPCGLGGHSLACFPSA